MLTRYNVECEDPYCALENVESERGEFVLWEDAHGVFDAAMELWPHLDRMGRLSFGTAKGAQAAQVLIDACRRAKEGR